MSSLSRVSQLALVAAGLWLVAVMPASAGGCSKFVGTADGWDKADAVGGAQAALAGAITDFKAQKKIASVSVSGMRAKPEPYWRESVSADLFVKPDVVTAKSYTVCWHGVVSPVVCSSGAKVCW
jgi:hypothetical protein